MLKGTPRLTDIVFSKALRKLDGSIGIVRFLIRARFDISVVIKGEIIPVSEGS